MDFVNFGNLHFLIKQKKKCLSIANGNVHTVVILMKIGHRFVEDVVGTDLLLLKSRNFL